jgi:uncharacterized protein YoxC
VNDWNEIFLGVIAVATLIMALIQIGIIVVGAKVAKQAQEAVGKAQTTLVSAQEAITSVREELRPLLAKATVVAEEASKSAALATTQVQKIDRLVTDVSRRVDETTAMVQQAILTPARESLAILAAIKAGLGVLRAGADWRRRVSRPEEEDPLFIG